ncbi:DNA internalization-related competence protein ComEC/Rec2 [Peribacillus sp. Hz7]|uniref:DNA internalization-related competence protein ComEC/Rec2 n=1 Tax=Peribacillus sp. Hz7 TaxID=3344873 RepID=UPI0035CC0901
MPTHILFLAVSATLGVAAHSSFQVKFILYILLFFCFLYYRFNGQLNILLMNGVTLLVFYMAAYLSDVYHQTGYTGEESSFEITFSTQPSVDGNLLKAAVTTSTKEILQLRYTIPSEMEKKAIETNLQIGLICPATGSLLEPEKNRNENSFNYKRYLQQQHIYWILEANSIVWADCRVGKKSIVTTLQQVRQAGITYVNVHFPSEAGSFVNALLFGDQTYISEEILTNYQRLGIVHLLAISGLHVSFLTGLLFYGGIRIGITREKMMMVILVCLPMYAILSGAAPSVLRACCMAMLFFLLLLWKKKVSASGTIGVVYLLLLFVQPSMLYNIGFQLSFAVTLAIIMSLTIVQSYPQKTMQLLIVSIVCQLAAVPILLYHFYEVSVLGVLLNVLYVPLYSAFLLPFSLVAFFTHLIFPSIGQLMIALLDQIFLLCNELAACISRLPLASIVFGKPFPIIMLLLVFVVISLFIQWESASLFKKKISIVVLVCILFFQYHIQKLNPYGEVVFIDIGQGDAILIKLPFNQGNYLIDTGGVITFPVAEWQKKRKTYNTGEDVILPFLKSKGIHEIDKLILTHPDADHIGGAAEIIEHFNVKEVVIGEGSESMYRDKEWIKWALAKHIPISTVKRGDSWSVAGAQFYILHPYQKDEDVNESSIVLAAKMGGLMWLLTGDAGEGTEQELLRAFPGLRVDILKAGHHGSKTSSSKVFLEKVQPKVAIISAGKENRYGHPHHQVIEEMEALHVTILRTDQKGAISYKYRHESGTFQTVLP